MLPILDDFDWQEAFEYANKTERCIGSDVSADGFTRNDVSAIDHLICGENDGESWLLVGHLKDGRVFCLDAWCDYTGWDCKAGGQTVVAHDLDHLVRYGMTQEQRSRCGLPEPS